MKYNSRRFTICNIRVLKSKFKREVWVWKAFEYIYIQEIIKFCKKSFFKCFQFEGI